MCGGMHYYANPPTMSTECTHSHAAACGKACCSISRFARQQRRCDMFECVCVSPYVPERLQVVCASMLLCVQYQHTETHTSRHACARSRSTLTYLVAHDRTQPRTVSCCFYFLAFGRQTKPSTHALAHRSPGWNRTRAFRVVCLAAISAPIADRRYATPAAGHARFR